MEGTAASSTPKYSRSVEFLWHLRSPPAQGSIRPDIRTECAFAAEAQLPDFEHVAPRDVEAAESGSRKPRGATLYWVTAGAPSRG